jgi:parvulin-like peptidyl-prolyl isomerase
VGAAVGIILAVAGALSFSGPLPGSSPSDVVARVNGKVITKATFSLALDRISRRRASDVTEEERARVLDRLIDEELLVQRGVEMGLVDSDRMVRRAIIMAVIDSIVADAIDPKPNESELRAFYESERALFVTPGRVHVQQIYLAPRGNRGKALHQAREAAAAIAKGMSFEAARVKYGYGDDVPVPDTPVPVHVLRRHLGPSLTRIVLDMTPGEISEPVESPAGYHLLHLVSFQPETVRSFESVRREVEAEYTRRRREEALGKALHRLRENASIVLSPTAPSVPENDGQV